MMMMRNKHVIKKKEKAGRTRQITNNDFLLFVNIENEFF